jgi:hypothetical protein
VPSNKHIDTDDKQRRRACCLRAGLTPCTTRLQALRGAIFRARAFRDKLLTTELCSQVGGDDASPVRRRRRI